MAKNFPVFYKREIFIALFTETLHWYLFWTKWIQFTFSCPISLRTAVTHKLTDSVQVFIWIFLLVLVCGTSPHDLYAPFRYILYKNDIALTWKRLRTQRCDSSCTVGVCERNTFLVLVAYTCLSLVTAALNLILYKLWRNVYYRGPKAHYPWNKNPLLNPVLSGSMHLSFSAFLTEIMQKL
jgi:hypothetical protein